MEKIQFRVMLIIFIIGIFLVIYSSSRFIKFTEEWEVENNKNSTLYFFKMCSDIVSGNMSELCRVQKDRWIESLFYVIMDIIIGSLFLLITKYFF